MPRCERHCGPPQSTPDFRRPRNLQRALRAAVQRSQQALKLAQLTIKKMTVELAYLRHKKYGRCPAGQAQLAPALR